MSLLRYATSLWRILFSWLQPTLINISLSLNLLQQKFNSSVYDKILKFTNTLIVISNSNYVILTSYTEITRWNCQGISIELWQIFACVEPSELRHLVSSVTSQVIAKSLNTKSLDTLDTKNIFTMFSTYLFCDDEILQRNLEEICHFGIGYVGSAILNSFEIIFFGNRP